MYKRVTEKKEYNKGFSLFTVIVSIAFVGILGMLVLYMAIANFHMKITDLKGKDSFYTAERAIEEIRVGLQEEVGDAMSEAYIEVLETYDQSGKSQDEVQDELRQKAFRQSFYDKLYDKIQEKVGHLKADYVDLTVGDNESLEIVEPTLSPAVKLNKDEVKKSSKVTLKDLKAVYVDEKGRASIIKTDIQMGIPSVKFATPSSLPDLMGMVVVANSGIICESDPIKDIKLTGNIYAGLLDDSDEGFPKDKKTSLLLKNNINLSIISADKFVCEGDINLAAGSSFTSNAGVELWAKGLTMTSSTASLLGDTYFADDLTVASGNGSSITIAGNYYGYGSVESAKKSHYKDQYENYSDKDLSSAIVINGKATKLDMSGVQKLMLAGKNYISPNETSNIMTGESVTVKGTQLAYLAPTEILGADSADTSGYTNPMTYEEAVAKGLAGNAIPVKWDTPVEVWNGKTLRDIGVDSENPIKQVFYPDNASGTVVYYYLNFTDETNAAKFMREYYQENPDIKKQMDKYLAFYFNGENSGIYVKDSETYLLYVTNGNILSYSGEDEEGKMYSATHPKLTNKLIQDQVDYQDEWFALNRKMVSNYNDLETSVSDSDNTIPPHNEADPSSTVFDNLVNEEKLKAFVQNETGQKYQYPKGDSPSVIMCNNGSQGTNTTLEITSKEAESVRLVVCTGDVEIAKDVQFRGIIMAKGKIIMNPGVQLEAAPLEAAKVFQSQIEDENSNGQTLKAQDFFWHGNEYVLGNTTNDIQNKDGELATYDLADCVTYSNWKKE